LHNLIIQIEAELGLADTTEWDRNDFDGEGFNEEHKDYGDHGMKRMKLTTMILILLQERSIVNTSVGLLRIYDWIYI
jgi:hypothetical protein